MPTLNLVERLSQALPLWAIGLVLVLISVLALECGAWVARRQLSGQPAAADGSKDTSDVQGYVVGAIFGLLAFLVGLTFSIALDRYDSRRGLVAQEATAISTAYLRADLFDEPVRSQLRQTMREYARTRVVPDGLDRDEIDKREEGSEVLRSKLWQQTHEAVMPVRETELASYFIEAMNNMLDVGTERSLAGRAHIPAQIVDMQFIYLVVAAGVLGYLLGAERSRRRYASSLLIVLFVLAFVMILDVDQPRAGSIKVSQRGLEQLVAQIDADAKHEAPATSAR